MPKINHKVGPNQLELWDSLAPTTTAAPETLFSSFQLDAIQAPRATSARLPAARKPDSATRVLDAGFARSRPLNILVADDNEINRKVIRVILQKLGYHCVEAANGEEALDLYRSGAYDYIFMDLDMPEMDGIEAAQAIRASEESDTRRAEIIAVTANVSDETRQRCRRAGMNGYLEKPITAAMIKNQLLRSWPRIRSRRGK